MFSESVLAICANDLTPYEPDAALRVERAIVELQRGRAIRISAGDSSMVVAAIESASLGNDTASVQATALILSGQRVAAIGTASISGPARINLGGSASVAQLRLWAGLSGSSNMATMNNFPVSAAGNLEIAALNITQLARLMPALVVFEEVTVDGGGTHVADTGSGANGPLSVRCSDIGEFGSACGQAVARVSSADVPLAAHASCQFIVYRNRFDHVEHIAVVIGDLDTTTPVLTRIHSACLTGDLFGSLRCDCGEQLRTAVEHMAEQGQGVLIYLAQEGRGIGLANKLRAYRLQDEGLDTIDADRYLGFAADHRNYHAACAILQDLGISSVRLLTNNPDKLAALSDAGIEVAEHLSLLVHANPHNAKYLETKRTRAGHLSDP